MKKTKAPLFDNAKVAAMLTETTRTPYDAHHLPIRTDEILGKNYSIVEFELRVDKDADLNGKQTADEIEENIQATEANSGNPQRQARTGAAPGAARTRTLYFEYDPATGKLTLPSTYAPEPRKPGWGVFAGLPTEKLWFSQENTICS